MITIKDLKNELEKYPDDLVVLILHELYGSDPTEANEINDFKTNTLGNILYISSGYPIEIEDFESRICRICKKPMIEGYCVNGGEEYYCTDKCLHQVYTEEEWEEMYEDGGDSYWTQWI